MSKYKFISILAALFRFREKFNPFYQIPYQFQVRYFNRIVYKKQSGSDHKNSVFFFAFALTLHCSDPSKISLFFL